MEQWSPQLGTSQRDCLFVFPSTNAASHRAAWKRARRKTRIASLPEPGSASRALGFSAKARGASWISCRRARQRIQADEQREEERHHPNRREPFAGVGGGFSHAALLTGAAGRNLRCRYALQGSMVGFSRGRRLPSGRCHPSDRAASNALRSASKTT